MKLQFECRSEGCPALIEYHPVGGGRESIACPRCGREHVACHTDRLARGELPHECPMCNGEEFFKRKDFPQKTGLLIVVVAAVASFVFLKRNAVMAYAILASAVVVDLLIYYMIGLVSVCYRCRTEYWGIRNNSDQEWFDLPTSEKYLEAFDRVECHGFAFGALLLPQPRTERVSK